MHIFWTLPQVQLATKITLDVPVDAKGGYSWGVATPCPLSKHFVSISRRVGYQPLQTKTSGLWIVPINIFLFVIRAVRLPPFWPLARWLRLENLLYLIQRISLCLCDNNGLKLWNSQHTTCFNYSKLSKT